MYACVFTFIWALSRIWLWGDAPSRLSHWSSIRSGSDRSSLMGITTDPREKSQLWDNCKEKVRYRGCKLCCNPNNIVVKHKNVVFAFSYLHNKVFIQRISNQEVKCLIPLGRAGAVRDLQHTVTNKEKINCSHTSLINELNSIGVKTTRFLTVVLWEVPLRISSAPTLGSFPLFFN